MHYKVRLKFDLSPAEMHKHPSPRLVIKSSFSVFLAVMFNVQGVKFIGTMITIHTILHNSLLSVLVHLSIFGADALCATK